MLALRLPACPAQLPTSFFRTVEPALAPDATPSDITQTLLALLAQEWPQVILGSDATPVTWWLLAASQLRLSDPAQAQREQTQTRSYRLVAQMDLCQQQGAPQSQTQALVQQLQQHLGDKSPENLSRSLAHSTQVQRFAHYLWLRALVHLPQTLDSARQAYVQLQPQWHSGKDHPWPLINAYRAWLLHDGGQHAQAQAHMQNAIQSCMDASHGPTLQWMAEVLRTLAYALGLQLPAPEQPSANERQQLQRLLPCAPHTALAAFAQAGLGTSHAQLLLHLAQCLPFNFH